MLRRLVRNVTGTARLEGRLVDVAEQPVASARVSLGDDIAPTTSDADGRFLFDQLAEGQYELHAEVDDLHARTWVQAGRSPTVVMRRRRMLRVIVRDGDAPVVGARVSLDGALLGVTDATGQARIRFGGTLQADVRADGYAPTRVPIGPDDDAQPADERVVTLVRGAPLEGTVIGFDGAPVASAFVEARGAAGSARTQADHQGAWRLPALAAGTYTLCAGSATQIATVPVTVVHDGATPQHDIVVRTARAAALAATVVDSRGLPCADAFVFLLQQVPRDPRGQRTSLLSRIPDVWRSDHQGRVSGTRLPPGSYTAFAVTADEASAERAVELVAGHPAAIELVLEPGRAIAGKVVDARGAPVARAVVSAATRSLHEEVTDEAGQFSLGGLPAGEYRLHARPPSGDWISSTGWASARAGDTDVTIVVPDPTRIIGTVVFEGSPMPRFGVALGAHLHGTIVTAFRDGRFAVSIKRAGSLQVMGPGSARKVIEIAAPVPGATVDLGEIVLERGQHVTGRVLDATGSPVRDARVTIGRLDRFYEGTSKLELAFRNQFETRTDEQGHYAFAGIGVLRPADERPPALTATHPDLGMAVAVALPTEDATIELTLHPTGAIDGVFDGPPSDRHKVIAERCDAPADRHHAGLDAAGTFTFARVPAGEYRVWLEDWRSDVLTKPVTVQVRAHERAIVRLAP